MTAEAADDGLSLHWLEVRREERSKAGSSWNTRVTVGRFENLPLVESGTGFRVQMDKDTVAQHLGVSWRRAETSASASAAAKAEEWTVIRCNSLTVKIRNGR